MANLLSIDEIQERAMQLFKRIPDCQNIHFYVSFKENNYDCMPFVEIDKKGYHFKCFERGRLIQDDVTLDLNELLYWIFHDITFEEACRYELKHREKYKDNRRMMFAKQLELLGYVGEYFVDRGKAHIQEILQSSPFDDRESSIFDFIDDFESIARALKDISQNDCQLSQEILGKVESVISKIEKSHQSGTSDILEFCTNLYEVMKSIDAELKGITRSSAGLAQQKERLDAVLVKAEDVLNGR